MKRYFEVIRNVNKDCSEQSRFAKNSKNEVYVATSVEKEAVDVSARDDPASESESDFSDSNFGFDSNENAASCSKKLYDQKYKQEWERLLDWLSQIKGQAYCKVCRESLANNITNLKRHAKTKNHLKKRKEAVHQPFISHSIKQTNSELEVAARSKLHKEIVCVMYCVKHTLPFTLMDSFPKLLEQIFPDTKGMIKCGRTKAAAMIDVIGSYFREQIASQLRVRKFSLIIDESTDVSSSKCLVLVARFFSDGNGIECIRDKFLGLRKLYDASANGITSSILSYMQELQIPISNMIGLATDNASVMQSDLNGVRAKLRELNPSMFYLGCTCHSLNLCASYSCKSLPNHLEKLLRDIYYNFSHSPKRQDSFKEFQECFNVEVHTILRVSSTRWLSLQSVIDRVLEQWSALWNYFNLSAFDGFNESILSGLNVTNKAYFYFLSYILNEINSINKLFQSENSIACLIFTSTEALFTNVQTNFLRPEHIGVKSDFSNPNFHLPIQQMFFGIKFEQIQVEMENVELEEVKRNCLQFYIVLCSQLLKRFEFENTDLKMLQYLNPRKIQGRTMQTILPLVNAFPFHFDSDLEVLNSQWRLLMRENNAFIEKFKLDGDRDIVKFWNELGKTDNVLEKPMFKEISSYMINLAVLPHSSAAAERKFSEMNSIKSDTTNKLPCETVENLMLCKELIRENNIDKNDIFEPHMELLCYFKKFKFSNSHYILK